MVGWVGCLVQLVGLVLLVGLVDCVGLVGWVCWVGWLNGWFVGVGGLVVRLVGRFD